MKTIEMSKEQRAAAVSSIQRYFEENMSERIGDLPAGLLLNFFLEEVGPVVYNRAISDAQTRMQQRMADLESDLYVPEFEYWGKVDRKKKGRS